MLRYTAFATATAITALAVGTPAFAQSAGAAEREDAEIVVTAQKREQNLADVPIAISVVGGEELVEQGASQLSDYAGYIPGLQVTGAGTPGQATLTLRGIAPLTGSQAVGIYLDDGPVGSSNIYNRSSTFAIDLLPYDIQRIEVLRGPQGTLYGASSIGGLVKYVTVDPATSAFTVRGGVEAFAIEGAGSLGYALNTLVSVPVVEDKVGLSGSFSWRRSPGWVDSVNAPALANQNASEQRGGRLALLLEPNDRLTVKLSGIWQTIAAEGNGQYAADLATGERIGSGRSYINYLPEPYDFGLDYYAATIGYDLGPVSITSATTYSETRGRQITDASHIFGVLFPLLTGGAIPAGRTPFAIDLELDKFTQELRLASPGGGRFEWLLGAFYTKEDTRNRQLLRSFDAAGAPIPSLDPLADAQLPASYEEYALFANGTFRFTDRIELTGGVRWARNEQTFRQISSGALLPLADDPGASEESVFTYSLSPQFRVSENAMIYGRIASGYRPGGPNVTLPGVPPTVDADRLTEYQIGFKGDLAGRMVTVDLAAFYMDWSDIQVTRSFGGINGQANGGKAVSKGVEGALTVRPLDGLELTAAGSYTDATLAEDVPEISGLDGDRLPNVPKFSGSLRADYGFDLAGGQRAAFGIGLRHSGSRLSLVESDPLAARSRAYTALDLNAAVTFAERWTLRAYARNLLDNKGELLRSTATNGLNEPVFFAITPLQPRTVGVALELAY